ncbi:hypothetical protein C9374_000432 [Naegleria lovaniensis]|uniref:Uncharacterized protein n=1 Tax=Naegleria lovaniensis TaxID=51637 RepID=A0AA88KN77_NAELO|nr:uncharacterized protein C9374_000432 [Naegleria lovaniensis]KAG2388268.1 hypothetical protein C9374_000432 [Naegleria lovaniensis]
MCYELIEELTQGVIRIDELQGLSTIAEEEMNELQEATDEKQLQNEICPTSVENSSQHTSIDPVEDLSFMMESSETCLETIQTATSNASSCQNEESRVGADESIPTEMQRQGEWSALIDLALKDVNSELGLRWSVFHNPSSSIGANHHECHHKEHHPFNMCISSIPFTSFDDGDDCTCITSISPVSVQQAAPRLQKHLAGLTSVEMNARFGNLTAFLPNAYTPVVFCDESNGCPSLSCASSSTASTSSNALSISIPKVRASNQECVLTTNQHHVNATTSPFIHLSNSATNSPPTTQPHDMAVSSFTQVHPPTRFVYYFDENHSFLNPSQSSKGTSVKSHHSLNAANTTSSTCDYVIPPSSSKITKRKTMTKAAKKKKQERSPTTSVSPMTIQGGNATQKQNGIRFSQNIFDEIQIENSHHDGKQLHFVHSNADEYQ